MSDLTVGLLGVALMLVLVFMGMRVAFAVSLVGTAGLIVVRGWEAGTSFVGFLPSSLVSTYVYSVIPLFILMGYLTHYANVTDDLFRAARAWVQHLPGGLAIATTLAGAGFAVVSGASTAATGVLGKMAIPQMLESGVDRRLAAGVVASSGTLAALIPPSALMVIYGIMTEQSVGRILIAGFLPGLLTVAVTSAVIYVRVRLNPAMAPISPPVPMRQRWQAMGGVWGAAFLAIVVLGGIYTGVFTPTEAAGIGAFGALLLALGMRRLTWENLKESLLETVQTTAMIFAIMVGISIFIRFLAVTGVTKYISSFVVGLPLPPTAILVAMLAVYFVLGMFMDALSMMMLTLPIFFPAIVALGFHPVWFGIIVVKMAEIALVSPPVGLNSFIVASVAPDIAIEDVFKGVLPFMVADLIVVALLIIFPDIALILPNLMKG